MAQYSSPKTEYDLNIDQRYYSTLDLTGFSQMMKDPSYCYKFYWLEAIVVLGKMLKEKKIKKIGTYKDARYTRNADVR
jgi:hypothetical protein